MALAMIVELHIEVDVDIENISRCVNATEL